MLCDSNMDPSRKDNQYEYGKSYVCNKCLNDHSHDIRLIEYFCFESNKRSGKGDEIQQCQHKADRVLVAWNGEKRCLERVQVPFIRPLPSVTSLTGGFKLCDGIRCKGMYCTYAHSMEEKIDWNVRTSQKQKITRVSRPLYARLTRVTYQEKFTALLKCERETHRGILKEK